MKSHTAIDDHGSKRIKLINHEKAYNLQLFLSVMPLNTTKIDNCELKLAFPSTSKKEICQFVPNFVSCNYNVMNLIQQVDFKTLSQILFFRNFSIFEQEASFL